MQICSPESREKNKKESDLHLSSQLEEMFSSVGQNTIIATQSSSDCHPGQLKYLTYK